MPEAGHPTLHPRRDSALGTLAQSASRVPLLLRNMRPTWSLASVAEITPAFLAQEQIRGLIWDIDGTLTGYHETAVLPAVAAAFGALLAVDGLRHAILSNAPEWRILELAGMFPAIPVVRGYQAGHRVVGRRLTGTLDEWFPAPLGEGELREAVALRKPSPDLVRLAVEALGCGPEGAVMVGDQHLTDVAGANLAGIRSIKVRNPARPTFPATIRLTQRLEGLLYRLVGRRYM
jgi:predicted HAD superfamily phosphohydrolase YqeG